MRWSGEKQARFDDLRHREMARPLSEAEQQELEALTSLLTQIADEALLPANERLQRQLAELETRLEQRQDKNEVLKKLLYQQEQKTAALRQC